MNKQYWIPIAAVLILTAAHTSAFADLNAQAVVTAFNGMNGGDGFRFSFTGSAAPGFERYGAMTTTAGYTATGNVNISAYAGTLQSGTTGTPARNFFRSFCVTPGLLINDGNYIGRLDYNTANGQTKTSDNFTLSVGAAYLYKEYATVLNANVFNLGSITTAAQIGLFTTALDVLMGRTTLANWSSNAYLNRLLQMHNSQSDWLQAYDTRQNDYGFVNIGNQSVFVMQVTNLSGGAAQNFLYLANAQVVPGGVVPEPATMLLWSIGGIGLVGSWARQRRVKKLAVA